MATKSNTLEGITSGATLTAGAGGNTGTGGDVFDAITTPASGGAVAAQSAAAVHGSRGGRITIGSVSGSGHVDWTTFGTVNTSTDLYVAKYVKLSTGYAGGGTGGSGLIRFMAGAALCARVDVGASSQLTLKDAAGTVQTSSANSAVPNNAPFRLEAHVKPGTGGTGTLEARLFIGANIEGSTPDTTISNTGMTLLSTVDGVQFGPVSALASATFEFDDVRLATGGTWLGSSTPPPTAAFTASPVGFVVNVDGTTSSAVSPASIASYDWNWGDATTHGTGSTSSHTYSTTGTFTITLTVTDTAGTTNQVSHNVAIANIGQTTTVAAINDSTNWTPTGGTALGVITDGDPTTLITSLAPPTAQHFDFTFGPLTPPPAGQPFKAFFAMDLLAGSTGTFNAQLFENDGTTQRSSLSGVAIASGSGSSVSNVVTLVFPATDVSAMSTGSWASGVKVKLQVTAS
jgi:hypothetical protein